MNIGTTIKKQNAPSLFPQKVHPLFSLTAIINKKIYGKINRTNVIISIFYWVSFKNGLNIIINNTVIRSDEIIMADQAIKFSLINPIENAINEYSKN